MFEIIEIFDIFKAKWKNDKKCYENNFSFQLDVAYIFFGNYGVVFKAHKTQIKVENRYLNLKAK